MAFTRAKDYLYVYRDVHSLHITNNKDAEHYFFNELPVALYDSSIIAANYISTVNAEIGEIEEEDIYSDFNLD